MSPVDAQNAMATFVLRLTAVGMSWPVITLIAHRGTGGRYDPDALHVFNRRGRGGVRWYRDGGDPRAAVSWAVGAAVGVCAVPTPYQGPLLP
ncbi:cytosine permease [Streptomyces sp. NBC_01497]|uniref:cytosine permease n=1 Tax=Streptomyces sp. NBC_01497 TaxID=2903885 RepID=UPI002E359B2B|nr:cytosine permease [Streptomyces sp. NBC_01497]